MLALGFDEGVGSVAVEASGSGLDGVLVGGPSWVAGRYGLALEFDGVDDLVRVADGDALDVSSGFTVAAWVRPDRLSNWQTVAMKSTGGGLAYGLYASGFGDPRPAVFMEGDDGGFLVRSRSLSTGQWQHLERW